MFNPTTPCIEEEYSFCLSHLWRRPNGWRPIFIYFRGPADVPFFIAPVLSVVGLWRFVRNPRKLADLDQAAFRDAKVTKVDFLLGSYGMGGPGFVGLRLKLPSTWARSVWMVFTVWGAAGWLTINEEVVAEGYDADERQQIARAYRLRSLTDLVGSTVENIRVEPDLAEVTFISAQSSAVLRLMRDSSFLPVLPGSKKPRIIPPAQDIRDTIIISRRAHLWIVERETPPGD